MIMRHVALNSTLSSSAYFRKFTNLSAKPILTEKPAKWSQANIADPDQMPHNVASDLGLHSLLTGFSIKNRLKAAK